MAAVSMCVGRTHFHVAGKIIKLFVACEQNEGKPYNIANTIAPLKPQTKSYCFVLTHFALYIIV